MITGGVHRSKKQHVHGGMSSIVYFHAQEFLSRLGDIRGSTVLDLGCGDGHISIHASKLVGESGRVYSIDVDPTSISLLKSKIEKEGIQNILPHLGDFSGGSPLDDRSIDLVLIVNVFHGFVVNGESKDVIVELIRILRPEGSVAFVEFRKEPDIPGPSLDKRLSPDDLRSILAPFGFIRTDTFDMGPMHYGAVFQAKG